MRGQTGPMGGVSYKAGHVRTPGLMLEPVLKAGGNRPLAFHRMVPTRADLSAEDNLRLVSAAIDALGWDQRIRISVAVAAAIFEDSFLRERLQRNLQSAADRAERLILEIPEDSIEAAEQGLFAGLAELGPAKALRLAGSLPRRAEELRTRCVDFLVLPTATASAQEAEDTAFVFGLLRQIADRLDLGLVVPGISTAEEAELLDELGADYLTGPAVGRRPAPVAPVA